MNDRGAGVHAFGGVLIGRLRLGRHRGRLVDPGRCWQRRRGRAATRKAFGVGGVGGDEDLGALVPFLLREPIVNVVRGHQAKRDVMVFLVVPGKEVAAESLGLGQ